MNDPYQKLVALYQRLLDIAKSEKNKYLATLIYLFVLVVALFVLIAVVIQKLSGNAL